MRPSHAAAYPSVYLSGGNEIENAGQMKPNTLEKVIARTIIDENGCWLWQGSKDTSGYGHVQFQGKLWKVHRVVYTCMVSEIPRGLTLDHLCRIRECCNPEHLEVVSNAENIRRGISANRQKTHCPQGHPYDDENTYFAPNGKRRCKACHRGRMNLINRRKRK